MEYRKMTTAKSDVVQIQCQRSVVICILVFLLATVPIILVLSVKIYTLEKRIYDVEIKLEKSISLNTVENDFGNGATMLQSTEMTSPDDGDFDLSLPGDNGRLGINRVKRSGKKKKNKIYGCHLVGDSGRSPRDRLSESFPMVRDYSSTGACQMTVNFFDSGYVKSIRITESGYYFVYAHVTLQGLAHDIFGFKTVFKESNCRRACTKKTLMSTVKTLRHGDVNASKESGYHAGLFYLKKNYDLSLERLEPIIAFQDFDVDKTRLFFGAIFMQKHTF